MPNWQTLNCATGVANKVAISGIKPTAILSTLIDGIRLSDDESAYITIILPVDLYGCETWSLTLKEERRLRAFENRVLRKIFGPEREEVRGEWGKLNNEKLHDLYTSPIIVRVIKSRTIICAWHVARMGEGRGVYRVLVGKPDGKRPLGRPRHR
jgi:hypothetical protein